MPTATRDFNLLNEHIEGLKPEQIAPEIGDIVARGNEQSPLAQIIIKNGGDLDADGPVSELLDTVEAAIARAPSNRIKAELGEKAVGTMAGALTYGNVRPWVPGSSERLAEHASRYADFIEDPRERAFSIVGFARKITHPAETGTARGSEDEVASLFVTAKDYFNQAAEAAAEIEDPDTRSRAYSWIAGHAAKNVGATDGHALIVDTSEAVAIFEQPVILFDKAGKAAGEIDDPAKRLKRKILNAQDMATAAASAARTAEADPSLLLGMMAQTEIDAVLEAYESGSVKGMKPGEACFQLSELGHQLAVMIDEKYKHAHESTEGMRHQLARKIVTAFDLARHQAREAVRKPRLGSGRRQSDLGNVPSNNATRSAGLLLESDPEAAKQILASGFHIGVAEDVERGPRSDSRSSVIGSIGSMARNEDRPIQPQLRFELFVLAHGLERGQLPRDKISHTLQVNARSWLQTVRGYDKIALDTGGEGYNFVDFAIRIAGEADHWASNLRDLIPALADYPGLQQKAMDQVEGMSERERKAREPKTKAARLAGQIIHRM